jgi:hypothetical protein
LSVSAGKYGLLELGGHMVSCPDDVAEQLHRIDRQLSKKF